MIKARTDGIVSKGFLFNKNVVEYALKDEVIFLDEKKEHFIVDKVPYIVDKYDMDKAIAARTEGQDIKSICKRMQDGEIFTDAHIGEYYDDRGLPHTREEFAELDRETSNIIDGTGKLSKEDLKQLGVLAKMTPKQLEEYVNNLIEKNKKINETNVNDSIKTDEVKKEEINNG